MMRTPLLLGVVLCRSVASASTLRVDRTTGHVTWENTGKRAFGSFGYEINSASGSLDPNTWRSIAEHGAADSGGSIDPTGTWDVWRSRSQSVAEASFDGTIQLSPGESIDLGMGLWRVNGEEDLEFNDFDVSTFELTPGSLEYFGTRPQHPAGRYNASGRVEQAGRWRNGSPRMKCSSRTTWPQLRSMPAS